MARLDLPRGEWAELREAISHGQSKRITAAAAGDDFLLADVLVREFVREWTVTDLDGQPIALGDEDAIDRMPQDTFDEIFAELVRRRKARLAAAPTPPSPDG